MRSELRKLTVLPTPRWTAAAVLASVLIAAIVVAITGTGRDATGGDQESLALIFGVTIPTWIASIVIGVWVAGLEYGQKTMRRTLSRNPNRLEVVGSKLATALIATVVLTLAATVISAPLLALASSGHEMGISVGDALRNGLGSLANNLIYVVAGFSFGLATRSMAGGMTIALGFFFVIDSLLAEIPKVGDFMISAVSGEIFQKIAGSEVAGTDLEVHLVRAVLASLVWAAVLIGLSSLRFVKTDVE